MNFRSLHFIPIACLAAPPAMAGLMDLSLSFDSRPSAQGWVYNNPYSGTAESRWVATGTSLVENGVGIGLGPFQGFSWYNYTPGVAEYSAVLPWTLTVTVKITDDEYFGPFYRHGYANYVFLGGYGFGFGVDRENVNMWDGDNFAVDVGSDFRTFTLSGDPISHNYSLRMDGTLIDAGVMAAGGDSIYMGDVTNNHNVDAEITSWQLSQVPEPSTWILAVTSLAWVGISRRSKR